MRPGMSYAGYRLCGLPSRCDVRIYRVGEIVKRADTGKFLEILEVIPNGLQLFYRTMELGTEHEGIFRPHQLRPLHDSEKLDT